VYLIHDPGTDTYKIGISTDPVRRVRQLTTAHSQGLRLLHQYPTRYAAKIERSLHQFHTDTRKLGEWFDLSPTSVREFLMRCRSFEDYYQQQARRFEVDELL
jgi:hypothetical protein